MCSSFPSAMLYKVTVFPLFIVDFHISETSVSGKEHSNIFLAYELNAITHSLIVYVSFLLFYLILQ